MRRNLSIIITVIIILTLAVLSLVFSNYSLTSHQLETLLILAIICGSSMLYCFIVGEITNNNSQMDKLWSILPIAYVWVVAARSITIRTLVIAVIVTVWGLRLTYNFARKGAYRLKFWTGEEDYRWAILRSKQPFTNRIIWGAFDLFFISIYQNLIVLAICLPALAVMDSTAPFGAMDYVATVLAVFFLALETEADEKQWKFYQTKKEYINEGKSLEEMPTPYSYGFNTTGIWRFMRHPNYLGEQGIWVAIYLFVLGAGVGTYYIFNWSIIGCLFLIFLFLGSSTLGENISKGKYPLYEKYQSQVHKYIPIRGFDPNR